MAKLRETAEPQLWQKRVGGGYPTMLDLELAAQFVSFPVLVGPPHPQLGFFMVMDTEAMPLLGYDQT